MCISVISFKNLVSREVEAQNRRWFYLGDCSVTYLGTPCTLCKIHMAYKKKNELNHIQRMKVSESIVNHTGNIDDC